MEQALKRSLSEMQGQLFEMSGKLGYDSQAFIKAFMRSDIAAGLDSEFDFMQWAGKEYIMERMQESCPEACLPGPVFAREVLYWAGYVYRYWHYCTGEDSKQIYKQANARTMSITYLAFHTLDVEQAIERLKEASKK